MKRFMLAIGVALYAVCICSGGTMETRGKLLYREAMVKFNPTRDESLALNLCRHITRYLYDGDVPVSGSNRRTILINAISSRDSLSLAQGIYRDRDIRSRTKNVVTPVGGVSGSTDSGIGFSGTIYQNRTVTRYSDKGFRTRVYNNAPRALELLRKATDCRCLEAGNEYAAAMFVEAVSGSDTSIYRSFKAAAEVGIHSAKFMQAVCLYYGIGAPVNQSLARRLISEVPDVYDGSTGSGGYSWAKNRVKELKTAESKVSSNAKSSSPWTFEGDKNAAETGDEQAQYRLGYCYENGVGVDKDEAEAVKWYRKSAEKGFAPAICSLGMCFERGHGVTKDEAKAVMWYRRAAAKGDAQAQCLLGGCYRDAKGVPEDFGEALRLFKVSAAQNYGFAMVQVGHCYYYGQGVQESLKTAVKWYRKAAEQNNPIGQCCLGECYYRGEGCEKDLSEAARLFAKAAQKEYPRAMCWLGLCYLYGDGIRKNPEHGVEWLGKAFGAGDVEAMFYLGLCYLDGCGVVKNSEQGMIFLRTAAKRGHEPARKHLEHFEGKFSGK